MGRVLSRDGDLKEGLQLRLMDPSTGEPYHEWYKYTGSEIVKIIQAAPATPPPVHTISPVPPLHSCQDCLSKLSCQ